MAFDRPTLSDLIVRAEGDLKAELRLTTILRRSLLSAFAKMQAGLSHLLHGHLEYNSRQLFPDQADEQNTLRWGAIRQILRKTATSAGLTSSGVGVDGSIIGADTVFQRTDGQTYTVVDEVTVAGGVYTVELLATTLGTSANVSVGDGLSLASPIAGVDGDVTVDSIVTEASDLESIEDYRARIIESFRNPIGGGSPTDYLQFALNVSGVTRSWVFPGHLGEGSVGISVVQDDQDPIIPDTAKIQEVQDYIDTVGPASANKVVFAPIAVETDFEIQLSPNTSAVQSAVQAEIKDLFARSGEVGGAYGGLGSTLSGTIPISKIREAISVAAGEDDHALIAPTNDLTVTTGEIRTVGSFSFSTLGT